MGVGSERARAVCKRACGPKLFGNPPYGYRDRDTSRLTP